MPAPNKKGAERLVDWEKARLNELFYRYPELRRAGCLRRASGVGTGERTGTESQFSHLLT